MTAAVSSVVSIWLDEDKIQVHEKTTYLFKEKERGQCTKESDNTSHNCWEKVWIRAKQPVVEKQWEPLRRM
jgi:hypothetical protein